MKELKSQYYLLLALTLIGGCASPHIIDKSDVVQGESHSLVGADEKILKQQVSGQYKSEPSHTSLIWRVGHLGLSNYTARSVSYTHLDVYKRQS